MKKRLDYLRRRRGGDEMASMPAALPANGAMRSGDGTGAGQ